MARILYVLWSTGGVTGGQKMIIRHVETLRDLGFDAVCYVSNRAPTLLEHRAPIVVRGPVMPDDIVVVPDDANETLRQCSQKPWRTVVFAQNPYFMAAMGLEGVDLLASTRPLTVMAVSDGLKRTLKRLYPAAAVEVVRCFADERLFGPARDKRRAVAYTPLKRKLEADAIVAMFKRLHRGHAGFGWAPVESATERVTADTFAAASVVLSLNRLESVGMTTLEAMASGCVCAGFRGVGGGEYATPDNGFWVPEDDCEAAVDALAEACAVVSEGGAALARRLEAGYETARLWSYAAFRGQLEATWMRIAPDARLQSTALDA